MAITNGRLPGGSNGSLSLTYKHLVPRSLSEYALNREPKFFLQTWNLHDQFHGSAHHCGPVLQVHGRGDLKLTNTSVMESKNSAIAAYRPRLSRTSKARALLLLQRAFYLNNIRERVKAALKAARLAAHAADEPR